MIKNFFFHKKIVKVSCDGIIFPEVSCEVAFQTYITPQKKSLNEFVDYETSLESPEYIYTAMRLSPRNLFMHTLLIILAATKK